jgi:hypothetical protein
MLQGRVIDTITSAGDIFFQPHPDSDAADDYPSERLASLNYLTSYPTPPSNHPLALPALPLHTTTSTPPRSLLAESNQRPHRDRAAGAGQDLHERRLDAADPEAGGANHVWPGARVCALGAGVCVTAWGYVGFVPVGARKGDEVCLLRGAQVPFAVRRRGGRGARTVPRACVSVGEAYLHGVMDGVLFGRGEREVRAEEFQIF